MLLISNIDRVFIYCFGFWFHVRVWLAIFSGFGFWVPKAYFLTSSFSIYFFGHQNDSIIAYLQRNHIYIRAISDIFFWVGGLWWSASALFPFPRSPLLQNTNCIVVFPFVSQDKIVIEELILFRYVLFLFLRSIKLLYKHDNKFDITWRVAQMIWDFQGCQWLSGTDPDSKRFVRRPFISGFRLKNPKL